jgi:hypothetical protein
MSLDETLSWGKELSDTGNVWANAPTTPSLISLIRALFPAPQLAGGMTLAPEMFSFAPSKSPSHIDLPLPHFLFCCITRPLPHRLALALLDTASRHG